MLRAFPGSLVHHPRDARLPAVLELLLPGGVILDAVVDRLGERRTRGGCRRRPARRRCRAGVPNFVHEASAQLISGPASSCSLFLASSAATLYASVNVG